MLKLFLALCLLIQPLRAVIQFDAASSGQSLANASTLTISHPTGSLINGYLVVGVSYFLLSVSVQGITYDSIPLTKARRDNNGAQNAASELWYLASPNTGTHDVVITMTGAVGGSSIIVGGVVSLQGVSQGAPEATVTCSPASTGTGCGSVLLGAHSSHGDTITTIAADAWAIDAISIFSTAPSFVAAGSQTSRVAVTALSNNSMAMSTLPVAVPAAQLMSWGFNNPSNLATAHSVISLAPSAGGTRHRVSIQ